MTTSDADMSRRLARFIGHQVGAPITVTRLERLPGGFLHESWLVDVTVESGQEEREHALVLRRDLLPAAPLEGLDRAAEFKLLQVLHSAGIAVPRPRWLGADPTILERPFFLMERVVGESRGERIVRRPDLTEARRRLPERLASELARIHNLDDTSGKLGFLPAPEPATTSPALQAVGRLREMADRLHLFNPSYEVAFRWLEKNTPDPPQRALVHGDFHIGNMIVGSEGLRAVIDWDSAHWGDPAADLGWLCVRDWRFGNDVLSVGGVCRREAFLSAYAAAGGLPVQPAAVRYWELMGNVKWAVACLSLAALHRSEGIVGVELAGLGRRAVEMELEFLTLIEQAEKEV